MAKSSRATRPGNPRLAHGFPTTTTKSIPRRTLLLPCTLCTIAITITDTRATTTASLPPASPAVLPFTFRGLGPYFLDCPFSVIRLCRARAGAAPAQHNTTPRKNRAEIVPAAETVRFHPIHRRCRQPTHSYRFASRTRAFAESCLHRLVSGKGFLSLTLGTDTSPCLPLFLGILHDKHGHLRIVDATTSPPTGSAVQLGQKALTASIVIPT